jgi:RHS repeat-associated protein
VKLQITARVVVACLLGTVVLTALDAAAQVQSQSAPAVNQLPVPITQRGTLRQVSPEQADRVLNARQPTSTGSQSAGALTAQGTVLGPASIAELARALKNDPDLIYEFVQNNIEYSPTYGALKGAWGTILDGRGNDFDQAALMVALLRQAGLTASYLYGQIRLTPTQAANWLGTSTSNNCAAVNVLTRGGIPNTYLPSGSCTSLTSIDVSHVWVQVTIGGTAYVFDPSFKTYTYTTGVNLTTAMGYSQSTLISSAETGTTLTSDYIQNVNRTNLRNTLTSYSNNLVSYIKSQTSPLSLDQVVGGRNINPASGTPLRQTSLPNQTPGVTPTSWTDIPTAYITTLRVQYAGGIDQTFNSPVIYGKALTLFHSSNQPILKLDGTTQATGTTLTANTFQTLTLTATHPFAGGTQTSTGTSQLYTSNGRYLLANGWDMTGRGMVNYHQKLLQQNLFTGGDPNSEAILGESFSVMAHTYFAEQARSHQLLDQIAGTVSVTFDILGVVGEHEGTGNPYFDVAANYAAITSKTNSATVENAAWMAQQLPNSGFESGVIEQMLKIKAVSTVNLIDVSNSQADKIFNATSSNYSTTVKPQLLNYSAAQLSYIDNLIADGKRVILPQHGNLQIDSWTGAGFEIIDTTGGIGSVIWGNVLGHVQAAVRGGDDADNEANDGTGGVNDNNSQDQQDQLSKSDQKRDPTSRGRIDLFTGDYYYDRQDLSVGTSKFPYRLTMVRSYVSGNRLVKGPLGLGWTHNFAITAKSDSDGLQGMGEDSPIDAASAIVSLYAAFDLLNPSQPLDRVVLSTLVTRWFMEQLVGNVVAVKGQAARPEVFVKLADGSYNPPLGSSTVLTVVSAPYTYTYTTKGGVQLLFNTAGNLVSWTNTAGMTVTLTYDTATPPKVITVANGLGRQLTLGYNASNQLAQVSDNSSPVRSVAYAYDAANSSANLTSFTDPAGKATTFSYDIPGRLTQVFYPSFPTPFVTNTYDTLGRLMTQADANNGPSNNTTWQYFLAGYRSEEVDPLGTRHVLYNNPRGKVTKVVRDLAGTNQTTTLNALDARDRVVTTTFQEGNTLSYAYDASDNLLSVTAATKPGSGLANIVRSFTYTKPITGNSIITRLQTATDPLSRVTSYSYDSTTGNLLSIVSDSGSAPHLNATRTFTYNAHGNVLTATGPVGTVTRYTYGGDERLLTITGDYGVAPHLNLTTSFGYDTTGNVTSRNNARGYSTTYGFDAARRVTSVTAPIAGISTSYTYDADGRRTQTQRSNGATPQTTSSTYTSTGKVATTTNANGFVTTYAYDLLDRVKTVTDPENRVTSRAYDTLGHLSTVTNTAIQATPLESYAYTPNGRMLSFTDARTKVTTYAYDGFDRLSQITYPLGSYEAFTYDAAGNTLSKRTRAAQTISFAYDNLNRPTTKTPPSPAPVVTYTYDLAGRVTHVGDNSAAIATAIPPTGTYVAYTSGYTYDALNRMTGVTWDNSATQTAASSVSVTFGHTYNKVNQRVSQSTTDDSWWFRPSAASTTNYTTNDLNQYTAVAGQSYGYSSNGDLTSDGVFTYGYDAENRMTSAAKTGTTASYAYDALSRRNSKTVNGTKTIFVSDGAREVLEYDGTSGQALRWYPYGSALDEALTRVGATPVGAGTRTMLIPDIQGSIVGELASSGTLTKFGYKPFGESNDNVSGSHRYTGRRIDAETNGLLYYRARIYSPTLGRFMQPDPIGYRGGRNLYAYVKNDPLNLTDLYGTDSGDENGNGYGDGSTGSGFGGLNAGEQAVDTSAVSGTISNASVAPLSEVTTEQREEIKEHVEVNVEIAKETLEAGSRLAKSVELSAETVATGAAIVSTVAPEAAAVAVGAKGVADVAGKIGLGLDVAAITVEGNKEAIVDSITDVAVGQINAQVRDINNQIGWGAYNAAGGLNGIFGGGP